MSNLISYTKVPVSFNTEVILATSLTFQNTANLSSDYQIGRRNVARVSSSQFIDNQVSITYYPTYRDIIFEAAKLFTRVTMNVGGVILDNGYVQNFKLSINAQQLIECEATIVFYSDPTGKLLKKGLNYLNRNFNKGPEDDDEPNIPHSSFSKLTQSLFKVPLSLEYNFKNEIIVRDTIGSKYPTEARLGRQQIDANLQGDYLEKFVTINGERASFILYPYDTCGESPVQRQYENSVQYFKGDTIPYTCNGQIQAININVEGNSWVKSSVNIVQYI